MEKSNRWIITILLVLTVLLTACGGSSEAQEIAVGQTAPNFTLTESDGHQVSLSDYQGQSVLLFFHMAGG